MSAEWDVKVCCMGAGYVGGPTMAIIAKQCPKVSPFRSTSGSVYRHVELLFCRVDGQRVIVLL